jgi:phosphate transport system permease protein
MGFAFLFLLAAAIGAYVMNLRAAAALRADGAKMHSLSFFHGGYAFLLVALPAVLFVLLWIIFQGPAITFLLASTLPPEQFDALGTGDRSLAISEIQSIARGRVFGEPDQWKMDAAERLNALRTWSPILMYVGLAAIIAAMFVVARRRVAPDFRARQGVEGIVLKLMLLCSLIAILTTVGIVASLMFETIRFFSMVPVTDFLFGMNWEPQIPIREGQIAAAGAFGWLPVFTGTLVITAVALFVAVPIGLLSAIYLNEFASRSVRAVAKPVLEVLAGVPTVVYGFFAILVVAPALRDFGRALGLDVAPNTALAAGSVMGIMLIPFISSFADDALSAVPRSLRDGALALGATRGETMLNVLFPAAIPGIVGGILLAVSRAIGETMIVVMAAGLMANMTANPLEAVTTVTVQIVTLLTGDTAFDNPKTLSAFALGMMLFIVTLCINVLALGIVRKYREIYD